jgi:hypothetical protein
MFQHPSARVESPRRRTQRTISTMPEESRPTNQAACVGCLMYNMPFRTTKSEIVV